MKLQFTPRAVRDLDRLPDDVRARVIRGLERLASSGHGDVRKLKDQSPPQWRMRVGDYRIIFRREGFGMLVLRVLHRSDAY